MAKKIDQRLADLLAKYGEDNTAVWDCHGTWVAYHAAVERMAAKAGVRFEAPTMIVNEPEKRTVVVMVKATMGDRSDWSFGEVSPANNKNAYPYAMAEKRAKDRVALKLLGMAGLVYSEEEVDDFKDSAPKQEVAAHKPANQLKKNGAWEALMAEIDAEMAKGPSLVEFDTELKRFFWNKGKSLGFNETWMNELKDVLIREREAIERATAVFDQAKNAGDLAVNAIKNMGGRVVDERLTDHPLMAGE